MLIHCLYLMGALDLGGSEVQLLHVFQNQSKINLRASLLHRKLGVLQEGFYGISTSARCIRPRFPFDPFYIFRLRKQIQHLQPDLIHAMQSLDAVYAWLACMGLGIPILLTIHGFPLQVGTLLTRWIPKLAYRKVDSVLFVSRYQQDWFNLRLQIPASKCQVLANGVDFRNISIRGPQDKSSFAKGLKLGSVGNFTSGRDHFFLCQLALQLKEEGIVFQLDLVGTSDPKAPEIYQACLDYISANGLQNQVSFLGSRADVPELLASWDVFVYASVHDTFGIAVVEAIASGIPIFVNDWEVMLEITQNGKLAQLYRSGSVDGLKEKILDFVDSPGEYLEFANQAANQVRSLYNIETHLNRLSSIYSELLSQQSSS